MDITHKASPFISLSVFLLSLLNTIQIGAQLDSLRLDTMRQQITLGHYANIHSILVQQFGELKYEAYFDGYTADSLHDTRSAFKSITSLLAGIALDKGYLESLDVPLLQFFPDFNPKDARKKAISLRLLLEMKGGFRVEEFYGLGPYLEDEMWEAEKWVKYSLEVPMKERPGLNFSYNSCEPLLLGAALSHAAGKSIMDFSKEY